MLAIEPPRHPWRQLPWWPVFEFRVRHGWSAPQAAAWAVAQAAGPVPSTRTLYRFSACLFANWIRSKGFKLAAAQIAWLRRRHVVPFWNCTCPETALCPGLPPQHTRRHSRRGTDGRFEADRDRSPRWREHDKGWWETPSLDRTRRIRRLLSARRPRKVGRVCPAVRIAREDDEQSLLGDGHVAVENHFKTAPPYLCVVGYSWAVALAWKRSFPSEPFLGIRVILTRCGSPLSPRQWPARSLGPCSSRLHRRSRTLGKRRLVKTSSCTRHQAFAWAVR
jgi:hypothetical protein